MSAELDRFPKISPNIMLTAKQDEAAWLIADDRLTDEQIAEKVGITRRTLTNWKRESMFQLRVQDNLVVIRKSVLSMGVADKVNRIKRLNTDWKRCQKVIDDRARRYTQVRNAPRPESEVDHSSISTSNVPEEAETGIVILIETPTKQGTKREWQVDTPLLAELRNIEKQAAQELGEWSEKTEMRVTTTVTAVDLNKLSTEDLNVLETIMEKAVPAIESA